jgi:SH3-like domain-containing protein
MQLIIIFLSLFLLSFDDLYSQEEHFQTLRNDIVNMRQGPSFDYPVKIIYKKKFLPVLIQDSSNNFRKVRDHENNSGWIHRSQLSKKKAAIVIDNDLIIFSSSTIYSNPLAILQKGRLVKVDKCKDEWCKVKSGEFKGWLKKVSLWGLF